MIKVAVKLNEDLQQKTKQLKSFFYDVLGISGNPEIITKDKFIQGTYSFSSSESVSSLRRKLETNEDFVDLEDSTQITDEGWVTTFEYNKEPNFSVMLVSSYSEKDNKVQVTGRF